MDKRFFALIAGASLLTCEVVHKVEKFDGRQAMADAPHNHVEFPEGPTVNVTAPMSASGQSGSTFYRLQLAPAYGIDSQGQNALLGYDAFGVPENFGGQRMGGRFETLESLLAALETKLGLPRPQIEATRLSLLRGGMSEIGGHFSGVTRIFREQYLDNFGLRFSSVN
jgi:hypothetical protein